jgi:hypothetical protein
VVARFPQLKVVQLLLTFELPHTNRSSAMRTVRSWVTLGTMLGLSQVAFAVDVPFSGALSATDPTFNRTLVGNPPTSLSGVGTAVSYDLLPFYVTLNDTYLAETLSATLSPGTADDTFIAIYQTAFNPLSPLTNVVIADDDTGVGNLSLATKALTAGTQYYLVVTSFSNGAFGNYTGHLDSTTGLGQVVLGAVPELPTSAMMLLSLGMAGALLRTRQNRKA